MALRFNENLNTYVLYSNDTTRAKESGLTLSRTTRGPNGELVWYTASADLDKTPVNNPYAVLNFYDQGDDLVKKRLYPLKRDYDFSWALKSDSSYPCPEGEHYDPYQVAAVDYVLNRRHSIVGDPPGVGKTIEAMAVANAMEAKRVLVFCPATIRKNWVRQIMRWTCLPKPIVHPIYKSSHGVNPYANFVVSSYNMAINMGIHTAMCSTDWDLIVTDEGHFLKNYDAKRTQHIFGGGAEETFKYNFIADRAERVISLTGTPLPNRPREAYTHARAMDWSCIDFLSEDNFRHRFNPSMRVKETKVREEVGREAELGARLRCNIMVRRDKEMLLPDLPEVRYDMCYIEENGAIREVLAKEKLIDFDPEELRNPDFVLDGQVSTLRREMGEAKISRIFEHVQYLLDVVEKPKIVLFNYHREVMRTLNFMLENYGVTCVMGGMTPHAKDQNIDAFVDLPQKRVIHMQIEAGGYGVDRLQDVCDHVVIGEPAWTHGTNEQAVQRVHRRGQLNSVFAEFLIVEGSMDEQVLSAMIGKAITTHKVLDKRW